MSELAFDHMLTDARERAGGASFEALLTAAGMRSPRRRPLCALDVDCEEGHL